MVNSAGDGGPGGVQGFGERNAGRVKWSPQGHRGLDEKGDGITVCQLRSLRRVKMCAGQKKKQRNDEFGANLVATKVDVSETIESTTGDGPFSRQGRKTATNKENGVSLPFVSLREGETPSSPRWPQEVAWSVISVSGSVVLDVERRAWR